MRSEIISHLDQLEKDEDIKILCAIESGSRAWGCPSPDSDYDVRIIFKRAFNQYIQIDEKPDTINYFHGKLLDINGWDIKKTLRLIRKSNATPFEWCQSPIVYREIPGFRSQILSLCKEYFQPRHSINHYKGIAKNSYYKHELSGELNLKKLFYVLRPIMAAKWIISKQTIPPMDIPNLIQIIDEIEIIDHINHLLSLKKSVNEDYKHILDPMIIDFIIREFKFIDNYQVVEDKLTPSSEMLNQVLRTLLED